MIHDTRLTPNGIATAADEQAVRDLFRLLLDAWGRGDGAAYGALFTEDADYVAFDSSNPAAPGDRREHQRLFDTWLKGTRLVGSQIDGLRFLGPDVALVHASGGTIFPGQKDTPGPAPVDPDARRRPSPRWLALHRLPQHPGSSGGTPPVDTLRALLPPVRP